MRRSTIIRSISALLLVSTWAPFVSQAQDRIPPEIVCKTGIIVVLPTSGTISIQAQEFDDGTTDNVTAPEDLHFYLNNNPALTEYTVNCDSFDNQGVRGEYRLDFFFNVSDEAGNVSTCGVELLVQDNKEICGEVYQRCSGCVKLWYSGEVLEAQLQCDTMTTSCYTAVLDQRRSMKFCKDDEYLNGISVKDLIQMKRHLLGIKDFEHPLQFLAADVNNSQSVSAGDISSLRKIILGVESDFSRWNQTSYRIFVESDNYDFNNLISELVLPEADSCPTYTDFVAVKIGDVAASIDDTLSGTQTRGHLTVRTEPVMLHGKPGVGVFVDDQFFVAGAEIKLTNEAFAPIEILPGQWSITKSDWIQKGSVIQVAWVNDDYENNSHPSSLPAFYLQSETDINRLTGTLIAFDNDLIAHQSDVTFVSSYQPIVSPNPVLRGNEVIIRTERNAHGDIPPLINLKGEQVGAQFGTVDSGLIMSTDELAPGIYFIQIEGNKTEKLIIF